MKSLVLVAAVSLGLAACATESNRGISATSQTDTMKPADGVARPIQAGGAASTPPAGGSMALPARGASSTAVPTTTTSGTALPPPTGTMTPPEVVRPR